MKKQTQERVEQLTDQFAAIRGVRGQWVLYDEDDNLIGPTTTIVVQRPDLETMHLQANNVNWSGASYVVDRDRNLRGTRFHYLLAVNTQHEVVGQLDWNKYPIEKRFEVYARDIFDHTNPDEVSYLLWIGGYRWYEAPSEQLERAGVYFGDEMRATELDIIVYPKPKNMSWEMLVEKADRQKNERDEAYRFLPKEMPHFAGIEEALRSGCRLHAFYSGGGLRVVRIEKGRILSGYGEHPHVEEALQHANEDYLAGGDTNPYGTKYPHYLTGSSEATSNIDHWVCRGESFDAWSRRGEIVFQLKGHKETEVPTWVINRLDENPEISEVVWQSRGFTYKTTRYVFANGKGGHSTQTVGRPDGAKDDFTYKITKTGKGPDFWSAVKAAFDADEVEVSS